MIRLAITLVVAFLASPASAQVYDNPTPLGEMLKRGYKIMAVVAPPLVTREMDIGPTESDAMKRNRVNRVQREIYIQNGFEAAVCFWDTHRAKAGCYSLTAGEN